MRGLCTNTQVYSTVVTGGAGFVVFIALFIIIALTRVSIQGLADVTCTYDVVLHGV